MKPWTATTPRHQPGAARPSHGVPAHPRQHLLAAALTASVLACTAAQAAPLPIGYVAGTVLQDSAGFEVNVAQQTRAQGARGRSDAVSLEAVSAAADLAAGTLKVRREVQLDNATAGYGGLATGLIGDGFVHQGQSGAFDWSGQTASFSIDIDGTNVLDAGPGDSFNFSIAFLVIYRKGTLDTFLPFCNGSVNGSHVYDNVLASFFWSIGDGVGHPCGPGVSFTGALDGDLVNTTLSASFQPGDDFDWVFGLRLGGALNANLPVGQTGSASWVQDFGQTATLSYTAPAGALVSSRSGVFPGTTSVVPEPGSLALLVLGLLGLAGALPGRRWRTGAVAGV